MKAFIAGVVAALVIAVGAAVILQNSNKTVDMAYTTQSARPTLEMHQN
ncbi:MAG TPA: hypothetical protein VKZ87_01840 [Ferrovibrio sp.]|jgi:hypothetical protein|nr:hypothetical protein [Ferrovibrio sp.]HLT76102.1 hypothetical protein [Ferrovibrio sp.]